jgi:exosome complex component MTR3
MESGKWYSSIFWSLSCLQQLLYSYYIVSYHLFYCCVPIRYGPREVVKKEEFSMIGQLTCEFKFATFSCRIRRQHQQDNEEKDYSSQLQEALEPAVCLVG